MKVSIITVCFNSENTIVDTISSVQQQSYHDIEYIIVDGGSTDKTLQLIDKSDYRPHHFISEPDRGIYDAMNKGLALASGDIIGILNSDDFYIDSDVVFDVVEVFKSNTNIDLLLGNVDFISTQNVDKVIREYSSFKFSPWKMRFGFMPAHPGAFIKKSAYEQVGNYKLGYKIAADFDIFVRLLLVNDLCYTKINKTIIRMRLGGISTSGFRSYLVTSNEVLRSLKENNIYSNIVMVLMRLPIKLLQSFLSRVGTKK